MRIFSHVTFAFLSLVLALFTGCATRMVSIHDEQPSFDRDELKNKTVKVLVSPKVNVLEFVKSYNDVYGDPEAFADIVGQKLSQALSTYTLSDVNVLNDESAQEFMSGSADASIGKVLRSSGADYVIHVISSSVNNSVRTSYSNNALGGMTSSSYESCIVSHDIDIWKVDEKKRVLSLTVSGKAEVFLFAFKTTLTDAVNISTRRLVDYLKTGKLDYI